MSNAPTLTDATLDISKGVATLSFNRDDVRNALTGTTLIDDICNTVEWINRDNSVSCLIITGNGKAFSSGGNVKEMRDGNGIFGGSPAEIAENYRRGIQRISLAMHSIEIPTIAAINGAAIGAGFDLTCMCDIRIGSEHTLLGETFINLGIIPGDGGAWFLQRLIGYQRAAELTFSGRLIKADEAKDLGILLELVSAEQLLPRAQELAANFASKPPQALRMTKRLMKSAQRLELADFLDLCSSYQASCHHSQDHQRAINAFLDKTDPEYQGN
ncbi:enoyl-CoA hydratase-related protein [Dasania marina]|uniref:enoyl-CoA hydratase-related protein n=1 Tax=Dasania marina TaxID=471499 RepID=UPI0030D74BDB|tara:strand:+ start:2384 stop:3199 length:816 start_codon:yes stop_codon:yes gene_type:complete